MVQFGMGGTTGFASSPGERFESYTAGLMRAVGHADRGEPPRLYCARLLMPGERESAEPMAARLVPDDVRSTHQRMHHLVANLPLSDRRVLTAVRDYALPVFEAHGGVQPGSWMTRESRRRASTSSGLPGSTAVSSESRTTARSR